MTGQPAKAAVDGYAEGYPGNAAREWSTNRGGAWSWLNLAFAAPTTVNRVVLYDRPNTSDQVLAGYLDFSDGTWVAVPALDNAGGPVTITFPARSVTSVRFSPSQVSATTGNIGLAEMQVWTPAG